MYETKEIPIEKIKVGEHDHRLEIDEDVVLGIMDSVERIGLLYPLLVVQRGDEYLVLDGHTRLEALKRLKYPTAMCSVAPSADGRCTEVAFAGNFFRQKMSAVELGAAIEQVYKSGAMDIGEIAKGFNRSAHWVHSMIAICGWPPDVQQAMHVGGMSIAAASNLACVTDDVYREFLIRNALEGGVTARTTAAWLQAWRSSQPAEEAVQAEPVPGAQSVQPAIPQSPCFICGQVFPVNMMSHVPIDGECIKTIRSQL